MATYRINPNSLDALAKQRARELTVKKAIAERFDFTRSSRDQVRRTAVYEVAAEALGALVSPPLTKLVQRLVREMGGVPCKPFNVRLFARVRPRAKELVPGEGVTAAEMRRAWYRRLADEGMDVERPGGELKELPRWREYRRDIQVAVFEKMQEDYWRRRRELDVWGMFAVDGLSVREIEQRTGIAKSWVHEIVQRFRREIGAPDDGTGHVDEG